MTAPSHYLNQCHSECLILNQCFESNDISAMGLGHIAGLLMQKKTNPWALVMEVKVFLFALSHRYIILCEYDGIAIEIIVWNSSYKCKKIYQIRLPNHFYWSVLIFLICLMYMYRHTCYFRVAELSTNSINEFYIPYNVSRCKHVFLHKFVAMR